MSNIFKKLKNVMNGKMVVALSPKKEKIKKIVKYSFCFGLPLLGAILGSTFGIIEYNKKLNPQNEIIVEVTKDEVNRRVYLISNDNLTIPLSVSLEKKSSFEKTSYIRIEKTQRSVWGIQKIIRKNLKVTL